MINSNFSLASGDLYICENGQPSFKIGTVDEAQIPIGDIDEECIDSTTRDFIHSLSNRQATFECTARITEEFIMEILGIRVAVLIACPNKRVVYLADHAKKKRTRKKNFHRAVKILDRG